MKQRPKASLDIIDSQSVKWRNKRALSSFDGNKKVKGIKRHVVVDKNGFLLAVMVTVANVHDSKAVLLLMQTLQEIFYNLKTITADGGYRGEIAVQVKKHFIYILQVVMRADNKKTNFEPMRKRWIFERRFSWFDNDRRLCTNFELLLETFEEMVKLSAVKL